MFGHAGQTGAPVVGGWGLSAADLTALNPRTALRRGSQNPREFAMSVARLPGARAASVTLLICAAFMTALPLGFSVLRDTAVSRTSAVLASAAVIVLLLLAALAATTTLTVKVAERMVLANKLFGLVRSEIEIDARDLGHVCPTSPSGQFPKHVLLRTAQGLSAVSCARADQVAWVISQARGRMTS